MDRQVLYVAAATVLGSCVAIGPAFASTQSSSGSGNEANSAQQLVNGATNTVAKIEADSHFDNLLKQAKGVFVMPTLVKGAFIVGGQGAQGVLLKHNSDGTWSDPAFLTIGSISIGAQVGGKAGPAAMLLMTNKALNDFSQGNNFSLNGNAGLTVIGYSAQGQAPVGKGDIVVWSDQSGAFAGATISGADVTQNTAQDHQYYGKQVNATQILAGKATNPGAGKLRSALPS